MFPAAQGLHRAIDSCSSIGQGVARWAIIFGGGANEILSHQNSLEEDAEAKVAYACRPGCRRVLLLAMAMPAHWASALVSFFCFHHHATTTMMLGLATGLRFFVWSHLATQALRSNSPPMQFHPSWDAQALAAQRHQKRKGLR